MTRAEYNSMVSRALEMYERAGIVLTDEEKGRIEVADLGLGIVEEVGLEILTYINTERVCAKEMCFFRTRPARSISMFQQAAL